MTFGSFIIPVQIDNIQIKAEFHIVPDADISLEAILGRSILNYVALQVTKTPHLNYKFMIFVRKII